MSFYTTTAISSVWRKSRGSIAGSTSETILSIPTSTLHTLNFVLSAYNDTEVEAITRGGMVNLFGSVVQDTIYAKLGKGIDVAIDIVISGSNLQVNVTNSETFTLSYELAYLKLG